MLAVGPHKGRIVSHRTRMAGDKVAASIKVEVGREQGEALIFLTEKAMPMARRALKVCGFDVDGMDLAMLDVQPTLLAGREVPLVCELYNGKSQLKIDLDGRAEKSALAELTKKLREAKKGGDADAGSEGAAEPVPPGTGTADYGEIPFALLLALPLMFAML
jgi:hypothetical protein